ncbi:MAG: DNA polymerase III subunit gamma/tau [Gammaproteobacteria bacterium]|nr:DNA polymerase III subunit gamma/tau [Gammaproteobacteria bacterium]
MKYQVLARKYRPKTFTTMMGQEHVLKALSNALESERLHHAYLFTGTRGVGKTTVARVLAKALNCEQGITASPCGECASCQEIDDGRFVDLIEVDAASRTKVEDTRELLDNVQYAPTRGRFKIYLIDEVHMLSGHSFNALLKTLEEPPPHVKFLLATTDPQKLPVTILSRCLQFNLKSLTIEQIEQQLDIILKAENIPFENNVLKPLAIAADGSMRDALSLMDQSIAYSDGKPNLADIEAMLGCVQKDRVFDLLEALANDDGKNLISQSRVLTGQGIDVNTILSELISTLQRVALCQMVPDAIDNSLGDKQALEVVSKSISPEDIQLYYQIALNGRKDLPFSPQPQGGFEMILLRMLAFKPAGGGSGGKKTTPNTVQKAVPQTQEKTFQENQSTVQAVTAHEPTQELEKKTVKSSPEVNHHASPHNNELSSVENKTPEPEPNVSQADYSGSNQINSDRINEELPPIDAYSMENYNDSSTAFEPDDGTPSSLRDVSDVNGARDSHQNLSVNGTNSLAASDESRNKQQRQIVNSNQAMNAHSANNTAVKTFASESSVHDNQTLEQVKEPSAGNQKPLAGNKSSVGNQNREVEQNSPQVDSSVQASSLAEVVPLFQSTETQQNIPCNKQESNELADYWHDIINRSELNGLEQQLAKHSALINKNEHNGEQLFELLLDSVHKHLLSDKIKTRLVNTLQDFLGCTLKLDIKECQVRPEEQLDTPRRREIHEAKVLQEQAVESIYADPKVQMIVNSFSAKIRKESIKPI